MTDANASVTRKAGMRTAEYSVLKELIEREQPLATLEIGMATGDSSLVFCQHHSSKGVGSHVAVDPFQSDLNVWKSEGIEKIRKAGVERFLELREEMDYLALPQLIRERRRFQMILIDGWHSFDYAFIDFFFADLLLDSGGVVVFHDTGMAAVYKVCTFVERNKPYERISPAPAVALPRLDARVGRRIRQLFLSAAGRRELRERRKVWYSLAAYRKLAEIQCPEREVSEF